MNCLYRQKERKIMTKRDIYTALMILVKNGALPESVNVLEDERSKIVVTPADFKAFAENEIAILDRRNAARAKHTSPKDLAKQSEDNALITAILDKYAPDTEIWASMVGKDFGISSQKASTLLRKASDRFVEIDRHRVEKGKSNVAIYKVTALDSEGEGQDKDLDTPEA